MNTLESTQQDSPVKCHLHRYIVRWVLLFFVIVGMGIGTIRVAFWRAWNQNAAVTRIERSWGRVTYKSETTESVLCTLFKSFCGQVICVWGAPGVHCNLEDVTQLPDLQQVELTGAQVHAADLAHLQSLPRLWTLSLDGTNVTDNDLEQLEGLVHLKWLNLSRTNITDKGLEHLKALRNLRLLFLEDTHITDSGEKMLQLTLPNCDISR